MKKSGLADSPFFHPVTSEARSSSETIFASPPVEPVTTPASHLATVTPSNHDTVIPSNHNTVIPSNHNTVTPSNHDTVIPSNHDTVIPQHRELVEFIKKAVREAGKEAATYRYTNEEKRLLKELVYTYGQRGVKTSENEVLRIGLNYLLLDFKNNGENSILHQALSSLNE